MDDGMFRRNAIRVDLVRSYGCAYGCHPPVRCGNAVGCFTMDRKLLRKGSKPDGVATSYYV